MMLQYRLDGSHAHFHLNTALWMVVTHFEVIHGEIVNRVHFPAEMDLGGLSRCSLKLSWLAISTHSLAARRGQDTHVRRPSLG